MEKVKIKPLVKIVRDPKTMIPLAKEGELKVMNTYWRRRLLDGSIEKVVAKKSFSTAISEDSSKNKKTKAKD